jgi:hypothetical protein
LYLFFWKGALVNTGASTGMDLLASHVTITGKVVSAPQRRQANSKLFFLTLSPVYKEEEGITNTTKAIKHVIVKHGRGGIFVDSDELEEFRRNVRCGDTIEVTVGGIEMFKPKGGLEEAELHHAVGARICAMHVHGNTGSARAVVFNRGGGGGGGWNEAGTSAILPPPSTDCVTTSITTAMLDEQDGDAEEKQQHDSSKERFAVFADFISEKFALNASSRIIEVAGGKGDLALLLALKGYRVLLVDPRENSGLLSKRQRKQIRKEGADANFSTHRAYFGNDDATALLISEFQPDIIVGLHPDEATEAIVDSAIANGVPFAVVPCCVYSRIFPGRRVDGTAVRTHGQLCRYLTGKKKGVQMEKLVGFSGKTTVVWSGGKGGGEQLSLCGGCLESP